MSRNTLFSIVVAALFATTAAPMGATTNDKLAYMTFNKSVQIPGAVLEAGTYRFHLADSNSSRKVMQVLSRDGSTVYSMFFTRADWRNKVTDEATVTFREMPAGVPAAVRSLFYGGEGRGYEFVYAKGELATVPVSPAQPLVTYTPMPVTTPEPLAAEPAAAFSETTPTATPALAAAPEDTAEATTAAPVPEELAKTASPLPLVALGGLLTLLAGLGAGLVRPRA